MKQVINVRKSIRVEDMPAPLCNDKEILVANVYSLISAGTERHSVEMHSKNMVSLSREIQKERPDMVAKVKALMKSQGIINTYKMVKDKLEEPNALGYSSAGIVIEVGKNVNSVKVGDRVACGGGGYAVHAEFIRVPENLCSGVPENVPLKYASFTTVGAIAMQGVRRADVRIGEKVVVIGLGLVGLLAAQIARAAGCDVFGFDISTHKVMLAKELGIKAFNSYKTDMFSAVSNETGGIGADAVIITASTKSDQPVNDAMRLIRKKGKVVVVGAVGMNIQRDAFYEKEGDFLISTSYGPGRYDPLYEEKGVDYPIAYVRWTEKRNMEAFIDLLSSGKVKIEPLITHVFPVNRGPEAYEAIKNPASVGVLIEYGKESKKAQPKRTVSITENQRRSAPIKIGVIGAGSFAKKFHLPNLKKNELVDIYAIATNTGSNAKYVAKKYRARYSTTDYRKILADKNIDAVVIATRHGIHSKIAIEALRSGKHVFVEKPAALNEGDLENLLSTAKSSGKVLMVGFNRRFSAFIVRANEELKKKAGPILVNYRVNAGKLSKEHWLYDPEEGGGRIIGEGVHFFDLINYLTAGSPISVSVSSPGHRVPESSPEDNFIVTIEYDNGSVGNLVYTSLGSAAYPKENIYIERDGMSIEIDDFRSIKIFKKSLHTMKRKQDKGHRREIEEFVKGINNGKITIPYDEIERAHRLAFIVSRNVRG